MTICPGCETVAHCSRHGCIPKTPLDGVPPNPAGLPLPITFVGEEPAPPGPPLLVSLWTLATTAVAAGIAASVIVRHLTN